MMVTVRYPLPVTLHRTLAEYLFNALLRLFVVELDSLVTSATNVQSVLAKYSTWEKSISLTSVSDVGSGFNDFKQNKVLQNTAPVLVEVFLLPGHSPLGNWKVINSIL